MLNLQKQVSFIHSFIRLSTLLFSIIKRESTLYQVKIINKSWLWLVPLRNGDQWELHREGVTLGKIIKVSEIFSMKLK